MTFKPTLLQYSLWLCLCLVSKSFIAQEYIYEINHYSVDEGLSHRNVQCIKQDNKGFLWLGTKNGLNRFDGYNFKSFNKKNNGLQSNEINHILEDQQGLFWLIDTDFRDNKTPNCIDLFNPYTEKVSTINEKFNSSLPFEPDQVTNFNSREDGVLIFHTLKNEAILYDTAFHTIPLADFKSERILNIHLAPNNLIWLTFNVLKSKSSKSKVGVIAFNQKGEIVHLITPESSVTHIEIIGFDEDGTCHFIYNNKVNNSFFYKIDENGELCQDAYLNELTADSDINFTSLTELSNINFKNRINYVMIDEFWLFDDTASWSKRLDNDFKELKTITDIIIGPNNNMWISTQFGFFRVYVKRNFFEKIAFGENGNVNRMRGLLIDEHNQLWAAVENRYEILKIDLNEKPYTPEVYTSLTSKKSSLTLPLQSSTYKFLENNKAEICYISKQTYTCFDPVSKKYHSLKLEGILEDYGTVWALYEAEDKNSWFTTDLGHLGYISDNDYYLLPELNNDKNLFYSYQFHKDQQGRVWIVSEGGLFVLDTEAKEIKARYWSNGENEYYLPYDNIQHLHEDKDGSFWLATANSGLVHWNAKSGDIEQFTRSDGLSNNTLYAVYEDNHGNLWLPSDFGINKFNKKTHNVTSYLVQDGITNNEFNRVSHCQHKDGTLFFGSLNGISAFNPDNFSHTDEQGQASMVITSFHQFISSEKTLVDKTVELNQTNKIILSSKDPFFRLGFSLLSFEDQANVQYAYKFEETDSDWTYIKDHDLRISHIDYGEHTLRIKGQDSRGQWSNNELTISVLRNTPFYLQKWFIALAVFVFVLLGSILYKIRISEINTLKQKLKEEVENRTQTIFNKNKILQSQAQKLKDLDTLKTNFFTNVAHELRTPLTILLGPLGSVVKSKQLDIRNSTLLKNAQDSGKNLLSLINQILDLSKLESSKLELHEQAVKLDSFILRNFVQFESQALLQNVNLEYVNKCPSDLVVMIDPHKLKRVIFNYLSNAIKFTPDRGHIEFSVYELDEDLVIKVKDSGPGIHLDDLPFIFNRFYQSEYNDTPSDSGTGIGLAIVMEYAKLFGGSAWVESIYGEGSSFYFKFAKKIAPTPNHLDEVLDISETLEAVPQIYNIQSDISPLQSLAVSQGSVDSSKLPNILIVEDNPNLRIYLSFIFDSRYNVFKARNGQEALVHLSAAQQPHLIITDIMMPIMDGFELIDRIKSDDNMRHLPVIVLTARADIKDKIKALRVGVDDYLIKPFNEEELLTRVSNIIRLSENRREIHSQINQETESKIKISQADADWLQKLEARAFDAMEKQQLSVSWLAYLSYLSERQFRRRLLKMTGLSPQKYLTQLRLQSAREMLEEGTFETIVEIAQKVGFKDASSFSRSYRKYFGRSPSEHFLH